MPVLVATADELTALAAQVTAQGTRIAALEAAQKPTPPPVPPAPATLWPSGGSRNLNAASGAVEWGNWRARPCTVQTVYSTRDAGWQTFIDTHSVTGMPSLYTDKTLTLIVQTSPFPTNVGATYPALIAGAYDSDWQQIGALLKQREAAGYAPVILSPAWEATQGYMPWGSGSAVGQYTNPAQYVAGFRRIVQQVRLAYPTCRIAWTVNAHATGSWNIYPGDDVVNYMGIDVYDHWPPAPTQAAFNVQANADGGIIWLTYLAKTHGKKIVVPEWGLDAAIGPNGGGDNPTYITAMFAVFQQLWGQGLLVGEYYFADPTVASDLISGNPNAAAAYKSLYKP